MSGRADLHLHTTASDGTWSPAELIQAVADVGLSCIAVTDHDTVAGVMEAQEAGREHGVEVIPGVELSVEHSGTEVHLLGYFIDPTDSTLLKTLSVYQSGRAQRIERMVQRLREHGCTITVDDVMVYAGDGSVGRPHVARALVQHGFADSVPDAFARWLGEGRPGYVPRDRLPLPEAIQLIHRTGGVAVCAHPGLLKATDLVESMRVYGLDGIEVVHSAHDLRMQQRFNVYAIKTGLARTGGSDSHGPGVKKGLYLGEYTIPLEWVERLKSRRRGKEQH